MLNPYKRLRELTGTSQKDFAAKYKFSKTAMIFVESGQFPEISDGMNIALGTECAAKGVDAKAILKAEYNSQTLADAYQTWKSGQRAQIAHAFQASPTGQSTSERSPFSFYVEQVAGTAQAFCKLLKVPSASVMRYSKGDTKTMPKAIEDALREVHFPYLAEMLALQANWVDEHR